MNTFKVSKVHDYDLWESEFITSTIPLLYKMLYYIIPEVDFFSPKNKKYIG